MAGMENISSHYRMEPRDDEKFYPTAVKKIVSEVLNEKLTGVSYEDKLATALALEITSVVRQRLKVLKMPRYKLMVQTFIGENLNQGLRVTSKSLWNSKYDNHASASFLSGNLWAVTMVFGSYFE